MSHSPPAPTDHITESEYVTQERKSTRTGGAGRGRTTRGPEAAAGSDSRPLSARSVVASTLLGIDPPRLPAALLVRSGELFGISGGTTRVALSRMVAAGELEVDDAGYRLAGHLLDRHTRQEASRAARRRAWEGGWELAVVAVERRAATERADLRDAMRRLKLAELREGLWLRPDNLDPDRSPDASAVLAAQCRRFTGQPVDDDPAVLAARLWDLDAWADRARELRAELARTQPALEAGDTGALAPTFVLSAAVLRHLLADPLLPPALLPASWPGQALRDDYDRFDASFKAVWRDWFRRQG